MAETAIDTPRIIEAAPSEKAIGGFEGASRTNRELASWRPAIISPDQRINQAKSIVDARAIDTQINDGYVTGAAAIHKDSIVGGQFLLNAQPDYRALGLDAKWSEEFQLEVESLFSLWAESINNWPDVARVNNLTAMVRLAVAGFLTTGEVIGVAHWLRQVDRPTRTAIQLVSPDRLCNPYDREDTQFLRRGIERDRFGRPIAYHFRTTHPSESYPGQSNYTWSRIPANKPWGRTQVIHIIEQIQPDQSRGISEMVSVLKQMKMTSKYQDVVLQNAVLNATIAASIESELPSEMVFDSLGASDRSNAASSFLQQIAEYSENSRNMHIDGVKIPHLYPGTKLKLQPALAPGGVGEDYEMSLLRHIAAGFGLSYEQFSRDYTNTNYSSARASANETHKFMQTRKKMVADRFASHVYALWFEEQLNAGNLTTVPKHINFYEGLNKEALTKATWIGASRGQIDEWKETQAAVLRIEKGLSTYEIESARLGLDFRELFAQRAREKELMETLGITVAAPTPAQSGETEQQRKELDEEDDGL